MHGKKAFRTFGWVLFFPLLLTTPEKSRAQMGTNYVHKAPANVLFISGDVSHPVAIDSKLIQSMQQVQLKVVNGHTNATETYSGVPLTDLLAKAGVPTGKDLHGKAMRLYLVAVGSDGYKAVLSLVETDASFHDGSQVIIADAMNGRPLDAANGPLKLIVAGDKHPARWVRNLTRIQVDTAN